MVHINEIGARVAILLCEVKTTRRAEEPSMLLQRLGLYLGHKPPVSLPVPVNTRSNLSFFCFLNARFIGSSQIDIGLVFNNSLPNESRHFG